MMSAPGAQTMEMNGKQIDDWFLVITLLKRGMVCASLFSWRPCLSWRFF